MADAQDVFGTVFAGGTATFLARVVGHDGTAVVPSGIASLTYAIHLLDDGDPNRRTPTVGHDGVSIPVESAIFAVLQRDAIWTQDAVGYNFRYTPNTTTNPAFASAGRRYRVTFTLTPTSGPPILARFCVHGI